MSYCRRIERDTVFVDGVGISYTDALFTTISASVSCGLIVIDTERVSVNGQVLLWLWMIFGNNIVISLYAVLYRRYISKLISLLMTGRYFLWKAIKDIQGRGRNVARHLEIEAGVATLLLIIIPLFMIIIVGTGAWTYAISLSVDGPQHYPNVLIREHRHISPAWAAIFLSWSGFSNAGISVFNDSLISVSQNEWIILYMCFLIIAGATGILSQYIWN